MSDPYEMQNRINEPKAKTIVQGLQMDLDRLLQETR
jgi:hypothetical protein